MIRYTNPPITLTVKGKDITDAEVYATIEQNDYRVTKSGADLEMEAVGDDTEIAFTLTQEESALFDASRLTKVQVNWIDGDGMRHATKMANIQVFDNLLDEVIND